MDLELDASPEAVLKNAFTSPRSSQKGKQRKTKRGSHKDQSLRGSERKMKKKMEGVEYVLPAALAAKVRDGTVDLRDGPRVTDYLKKMARQEYKSIIKSTRIPRTWAEKLQVFPSATSYFAYAKNRYRDVLADEKSRVKLEGLEHDYINANMICGQDLPGHPRCTYIACQAPLPATVSDFWWMVWQKNSCVIVMLTRFREKGTIKAHPYWPKGVGESEDYGQITVTLVTQKSLPGICISTMQIALQEGSNGAAERQRIVYHLHYTEWPDFGVPRTTKVLRCLISYTNLYLELGLTQGLDGPIISHCSAGVGRTGTFIAIHSGIALIESNVTPDVQGTVLSMRKCRSGMIQTDSQYLLVYEALNDHIHQYKDAKKPQRSVSSATSLSCVLPKAPRCRGPRPRSMSVSDVLKDDAALGLEEENDSDDLSL